MKTLRQIAIIISLLTTGHVLGDELHVDNVSIEPASTKEISIVLNNPDKSYTLLEFSLSLPEGVSIAKDANDDWMVVPNTARLTSSHTMDIEQQADGSYKFLIYSTAGKAIMGTSGEIFKITLTASATSEGGDGRLYEQLLVDMDENGFEPEPCTFNIEVAAMIPGDVNHDGFVTIADVTALVNIILGKDNNPPYQYDHQAANVNGDTIITIADVTALVNIILGKN